MDVIAAIVGKVIIVVNNEAVVAQEVILANVLILLA